MALSSSQKSITAASQSRARFSGHGDSLGAGGYIDPEDYANSEFDFLAKPGETMSISPPEGGFDKINIGAAWDNMRRPVLGKVGRFLGLSRKANIDLDLGCLYEMADGRRGAIQAFGGPYGAFEDDPYICLSGDERTGDAPGDDEYISINGLHWDKIKRVIVYIYIYEGAIDWDQVKPQIHIRIPGQPPMVVTPSTHHRDLALCVIGGIENVRAGLKLTNYTEFYPGHVEMDRAFGFGLHWGDGAKSE